MKEAEFKAWLEAEGYSKGTVGTQMADVRRVDRAYGDLDNLPPGQTIASIRQSLVYSKADQRAGRPNPAKFPIDGSLYDSLASYRAALNFYQRFLDAGAVARGGSTFDLTAQDNLARLLNMTPPKTECARCPASMWRTVDGALVCFCGMLRQITWQMSAKWATEACEGRLIALLRWRAEQQRATADEAPGE